MRSESAKYHLPVRCSQRLYCAGFSCIGGGIAVALANFVEKNAKVVIVVSMMLLAVLTLVEVVSIWPVVTFISRILTGLAVAFAQVIFSSIMIKQVAPEYIGRTNGIITPLMMLGMLIGSASSGFIVLHMSLFGAYSVAAILTLLGALVTTKLTFKNK